MDRKGARGTKQKAMIDGIKKRRPVGRYKSAKNVHISTKAKKLRSSKNANITVAPNMGYRILNFMLVFTSLSKHLGCKSCGRDVTFEEVGTQGLGFKIVIKCASCDPVSINSSSYIGHSFEINKRFFFAMRVLGIGWDRSQVFCGLMDLPRTVCRSVYREIVNHMRNSCEAVCNMSLQRSVAEEKIQTMKTTGKTDLTVSGDGTWRKRGFSSLYGVTTLIGLYSKKVLDIIVKSSYCTFCKQWKNRKGTEEYENWAKTHEGNCDANHTGASGNMETKGVVEMFLRSVEKLGVRFTTYIGDGDSKTFRAILDSIPYGNQLTVQKKECINHVQKRMGTRLRNRKKQYAEQEKKSSQLKGGKNKKNKTLGGRGKLTAKLIDELSIYYGLAIRRNTDSVEKMCNAIWATFFHKISTDKIPQHHLCPQGEDSWCSWQRANSAGELVYYNHVPPLDKDVEEAIKPSTRI